MEPLSKPPFWMMGLPVLQAVDAEVVAVDVVDGKLEVEDCGGATFTTTIEVL